jgi:hypothetical protein
MRKIFFSFLSVYCSDVVTHKGAPIQIFFWGGGGWRNDKDSRDKGRVKNQRNIEKIKVSSAFLQASIETCVLSKHRYKKLQFFKSQRLFEFYMTVRKKRLKIMKHFFRKHI